MKTKLAMFSDSFYPVLGGREHVINNLTCAHLKHIDARVFTPFIKGEMKGYEDCNLPYKVYRCNAISFGKLGVLSFANKNFRKQVQEFAPNIIHCQTKYGLLNYAFKYRKKFDVPVITTMHTNYPVIYYNTLKPKFVAKFALNRVVKQLNKCNGIISVSEQRKQQMIDLGVTTPITVIKNGINFYNIKSDEKQELEILEKYAPSMIDKNKLQLIFIGRLEDVKNIKFSLKVVQILKNNGCNFHFTLIGNGKDMNKYVNFVESNNLTSDVTFTGRIDDEEVKNVLLKNASLFLFPSLTESDSLAILETAYQKTPSLVIENTTNVERITNNFNGYICANNENIVANKILEIANNKQELKKVSENAFNSIPENWEMVAHKYEAYYEEIIRSFNNKN